MIKLIAEEIISHTGKKLSKIDNREIRIEKFEVSLPCVPYRESMLVVGEDQFWVKDIVFIDGKDTVKIYLEYFSKAL